MENFADLLEGRGEGEELAEGVPAEVVFLGKLLDMFRGRAASTGFEESTAVHQRDDGEHLGAGADLEDGKKVGVIVAEDIAGDGDGIETLDDSF